MNRLIRWTAMAAVGVLAVGVPAEAAPPPPAEASGAAATASPSRVTLITGDVVELVEASPGRYAASVRPAPGREAITFHTLEVDGGLRVLPSDVVPYVSTGVLDGDLFDVQELIEQGYGDEAAPNLPLIIRYQETGRQTIAGARSVSRLDSIGAAAIVEDKDGLTGFWRAAAGSSPGVRSLGVDTPQLGSGIAQIWLDGRVKPTLDRSVPQIGAPAAWASGYDGDGVTVAVLDTGIDAAHPDVAGKISATRNFSNSATTADKFGHGTHVASTIAGTGAASDGRRKGVAPGANLLIGKVLNDSGSGNESWIIAGMEWAVSSGADVVNMSLGGSATDGTDPLSEAVNRLTASSGTLFVVSAGNEGEESTVGTPGAADAALTVGAVDRDESLASFSSRGPRLGDYAVKPEITAPGVGIVAARAAGTAMGTPVDAYYTAASGTSMAAPHVAGAAAILAQRHPDWNAAQLKDALVSTARTNPALTVHQQGAGRVDVARATAQQVHATGVLNFGVHTDTTPAEAPITRQVSVTNTGDSAVTLSLAARLENLDSHAADQDAVALGADQIVVPAGTSRQVPVTIDPAKLTRGRHGGWLTANGADGALTTTALAVTLDGPKHTVTLHGVDRSGADTSVSVVALHGADPRSDVVKWIQKGKPLTVEVEEGNYLLHGLISDGGPLDSQATLITDPQLKVTRDLEVVIDARKGTPITIETPKPAEQQAVLSYYVHRTFGNGRSISHGVMHFSTVQQVNVTPTDPVTDGDYEFASRWQLVAPMVSAHVSGVSGPLDINLLHRSPAFDGVRNFPLVWAGTGTEAELTAAGVRGAAVLMDSAKGRSESTQVAAAAAAGAAAALIVRPATQSAWTVWRPIATREPIPAMVVANDDGQRLKAAATTGKPMLSLTLTVSSPYLYDVFHVERGRIPSQVVHKVTAENSARIITRYANTGGDEWAKEQRFGWRPWQTYSWNDTQRMVRTGGEREEWVSAGDSVWQHRVAHYYTWDEMNPLGLGMRDAPRSYQGDSRLREDWFTPVVRPAAPRGVAGLVSTRRGDILALRVPEFVDAAGHYTLSGGGGERDLVSARLSRDGAVLAELPDARRDVPTVAADASYRLELTTERASKEWQWATRTQTAWDFRSGRPDGDPEEPRPLPLLQLDYTVPADLAGTVPGDHPHNIGIALRNQDGLAAPAGGSVGVEVSFDEGATWRSVKVAGEDGVFHALVPPGTGTVSLRVHGADADGNEVTQTILRAYGLR
ncbi:S8 family serine peptidase [Micromonospora sp. CB01531]|uniref:S8 family serine peptidase n=1 Tax=Micromonospora sp. CB01531 TaxID=1718947 RepID=UPI00093952CB|nr:S8 family serine peptidase [Micromonospora sp. CB01531]OKI65093.1 peptidase S8 [Micromonospora sp. CB01531]